MQNVKLRTVFAKLLHNLLTDIWMAIVNNVIRAVRLKYIRDKHDWNNIRIFR